MANQNLFDALTRHQIYVEEVKLGLNKDFNNVLIELNTELNIIFAALQNSQLDSLTKKQLSQLLKKVRIAESKVYGKFERGFEKSLQEFLSIDLSILKEIFKILEGRDIEDAVELKENDDVIGAVFLLSTALLLGSKTSNSKLWAKINKELIPADGLLIDQSINSVVDASSKLVENEIRKGYANKRHASDVLASIVGSKSKNWKNGHFSKIFTYAGSAISTIIQHVSSFVQGAIASHYYGKYVWNSVIDNRTTDICIFRNGKIYIFGKGPLPPAHRRCRSTIWPLRGKITDDAIAASYYSWIKRQPDQIQNDVLGVSKAQGLRKGDLRSEDFQAFENIKALSISDFKNKGKMILLGLGK